MLFTFTARSRFPVLSSAPGSLADYGTLHALGSLNDYGTLMQDGSLQGYGTITRHGSLFWPGALEGYGSLAQHGAPQVVRLAQVPRHSPILRL